MFYMKTNVIRVTVCGEMLARVTFASATQVQFPSEDDFLIFFLFQFNLLCSLNVPTFGKCARAQTHFLTTYL